VVTETFGILAVRGAGKSNAAATMAEEMFKATLPFVVIDPVRATTTFPSGRCGKRRSWFCAWENIVRRGRNRGLGVTLIGLLAPTDGLFR